jgi:AcrR family transcriptional regulator
MPAHAPPPTAATKAELSARAARRERKRDRSREEILEAARRVLLQSGVASMTLDAVAKEVGVSKTALYYYFPSKDALLFDLIFGVLDAHAHQVQVAVGDAPDGARAIGALIHESVTTFASHLEDFRLAFLHGQVASPGSVHFDAEQFARIRPLNNLILAGVAAKIAQGQGDEGNRAGIEPRLLAFLAYLAAIGVLTMKGMVESLKDPLAFSDSQLIDGFTRVFAVAAAPK